VISIITVIYWFSQNFAEFWLSQSIIAREKTNNDELTSIFWTNLFICFVVFLVVNLLAWPLAGFYNYPDLEFLIRTLSIIFLLEPPSLVFKALLQKELRFPILEKVVIFKNIIQLLFMIVLILLWFEVLSYILAMIFGVIFSTIIFTYVFIKEKIWFPSFHFVLNDIKEHYSFGVYVTGQSMLNFFWTRRDEIIIAKILWLEELWIYYFAKNLLKKPTQLIITSFKQILFPMFSKVWESNKAEIKKLFLQISVVLSTIWIFIFGLVIFLTPYIIPTVFWNDWIDAIFLVQIFAVISFIELMAWVLHPSVLLTYKQPKFLFILNLYFTIIRILAFLLAAFISLKAVVISYLLVLLVKWYFTRKKINNLIDMWFLEYFYKIRKSLQNWFIVFAISFIIVYLIDIKQMRIKFILIFIAFSSIFLVLSYIRDKKTFLYFLNEIKWLIK
jgi:O-antigen/teichoic acid export membrane protein